MAYPSVWTRELLLAEYVTAGLSQKEIAAKYGRSQGGVCRALLRFGISARSKATRNQQGERNHRWKGTAASYFSKHKRIRRLLGTPQRCAKCGTTEPGRYEWANKTGNFDDPDDYVRLCKSCHCTFDGLIANITGGERIKGTLNVAT